MSQAQQDRGFIGGDYRSQRTSSVTACATLCANEQQCVAITYMPDGICWLKSTTPDLVPAGGVVSATKRTRQNPRAVRPPVANPAASRPN
jgi:hypothetical protein